MAARPAHRRLPHPAEITAVAADLLAAHHPGLRPPAPVRSAGATPWRASRAPRGPWPPPAHLEALAAALSLATQAELTADVVLLTPAQAKGLEFDAVLVADPAAILAANPLGHNDLYVAMTRATRSLGIVHPGAPPDVLSALRAVTL